MASNSPCCDLEDTNVMGTKHTGKRPAVKPQRPDEGFPLFPHNNGQWDKRVKGQLYCLGVWADPDAAFPKY